MYFTACQHFFALLKQKLGKNCVTDKKAFITKADTTVSLKQKSCLNKALHPRHIVIHFSTRKFAVFVCRDPALKSKSEHYVFSHAFFIRYMRPLLNYILSAKKCVYIS